MVLLTRKAEFSSAHYYWNDSWSAQENQRIFGKCANRNGHGHNYTLEVTVAGEVDPVSGFVVDLKQLKEILEREVVSVYDHRHLNLEVPEFATRIPTTENIAIRRPQPLPGRTSRAAITSARRTGCTLTPSPRTRIPPGTASACIHARADINQH